MRSTTSSAVPIVCSRRPGLQVEPEGDSEDSRRVSVEAASRTG